MKEHKKLPEVVDKSETELEEIFHLIRESSFPEATKEFVIKCIELARWLPLQLQNKKISLNRLRKLLFGRGYKKPKEKDKPEEQDKKDDEGEGKGKQPPQSTENASSTPDADAGNDKGAPTSKTPAEDDKRSLVQANEEKRPGHGRMPHSVYEDFTLIELTIDDVKAGDPCPKIPCGGKIRNYPPGIIVRIKGQNFADVYKYTIEKLRCDLCGFLLSANIPSEAGSEKYDASFKAILALQKYYVAVPFYRQEYFQKLIKFPLSDATQWDLVEQVGGCCYQVFERLKMIAANGKLVHNDDTTVRILDVIKEIKDNPDLERTGMYTTGIIAEHEGHQIALFINGRQHAGENLDDILKYRSLDKAPIIQMADALNANIPKGLETILCNCLSHGFRKFSELVDYFPEECMQIMVLLGEVFENDTRTKAMSDEERLKYHQQHSAPVMQALKQYIDKLLDEHLVEPNSELGKALKYLRKHWRKLTKFLTVAGAPINNNVVERALKIAIRNRKAAMFYRTCYSAKIGGMLTSLIYTCHLAGENAHHYLIALQQYKKQIFGNAQHWLPWNYKQTAAIIQDHANAEERAPPVVCPEPT